MSSMPVLQSAAARGFIITKEEELPAVGVLPKDFQAKPHIVVDSPKNVSEDVWTVSVIVFVNDMEDKSGEFIYQSVEKTAEQGKILNYSISSNSLKDYAHILKIRHNCDITLKAWYRTQESPAKRTVDRAATIFIPSNLERKGPGIVQLNLVRLNLSEVFKNSIPSNVEDLCWIP